MAAQGQYYVEVTDVTNAGATVTDFTVSIGTDTRTFEPGDAPLIFGPFANNALGGGVQVVEVTDNNNGGPMTFREIPELLCGYTTTTGVVAGGTTSTPGLNAAGAFCTGPTTDPTVMTGAVIVQSAPGSFMSGGTSGQVQAYILVRNDIIVTSNMTGLFTGLSSDEYEVYAINYRSDEPIAGFLIAGESIVPILEGVDSDPGNSPLDGFCYVVCNIGQEIMVPVNCMSIGSTVFTDLNNDGLFDETAGSTEMGIPSVTIELYAAGATPGTDMPLATTMTDGDGNYFFGGLEQGGYVVYIPTAPMGFTSSSTPMDGEADDMVDGNDNGIQATPGAPVTSSVITLTAQTEPTTAEMGSGSMQDDNVANADGSMSNDDANGDMTVDFGFTPTMSLGSTVFYDTNNDGAQDAANPLEYGIAGVTVTLYMDTDGNGVYTPGTDVQVGSPVLTDMNGDYFFGNLAPGDYIVGASAPMDASVASTNAVTDPDDNVDGLNDGTQAADGDVSYSMAITLVPLMEPDNTVETAQGNMQDDDMDTNGNMTVDFSFQPSGSVGSTVFFDFDNNGMQDAANPNEAGIEGVTVQLFADLDGDGTPETQVGEVMTGSMGEYYFGDLPNGTYSVVIPTAPANAMTNSTGQDAGSTDPDLENGAQASPGDPTSSAPFMLVAGNQPIGADEANTNDAQDDGTMNNPDEDGNMTIDFGFIPSFSLGSTVFADLNNNGMQDAGEMGLPGITVTLYEADGVTVITTDVTDANGDYFFGELAPGDYVVGILPTAELPLSSTMDEVNPNDDVDLNDNGLQPGGCRHAHSLRRGHAGWNHPRAERRG